MRGTMHMFSRCAIDCQIATPMVKPAQFDPPCRVISRGCERIKSSKSIGQTVKSRFNPLSTYVTLAVTMETR